MKENFVKQARRIWKGTRYVMSTAKDKGNDEIAKRKT